MKKLSREFQIFVKPVGAECNLRCTYCYYLDKKALYPSAKKTLMSDNILEKYIIQHLESSEPVISFSWHGGEPLLAGLNFYKKVVNLQKRHKPQGSIVMNGIQTNGTLLNDEWCRFFKSENFTVGISLDGPERFHDRQRLTVDRKPVFSKVMNGLRILQKFRIPVEILCVVSSANVEHPGEIYNFFKASGAQYLSFLPLVNTKPGSSEVTSDSVPSEKFGEFLIAIFDEWVAKDIGKIKIQIFEEALRTAFRQGHTLCIFRETCGGVPIIEHTGDFYSCDHYVDPNHLIGNISDGSVSEFLECDAQLRFGDQKRDLLPRYCKECHVLGMCNGECPKNRFLNSPSGEPGLNYLCKGYKLFFTHSRPFVEAVSNVWENS